MEASVVKHAMSWSPLKASDRCDAGDCNARSVVRVFFDESHVDFCGHHLTRVESKALTANLALVEALGNPTHIQDERARIIAEEGRREGV